MLSPEPLGKGTPLVQPRSLVVSSLLATLRSRRLVTRIRGERSGGADDELRNLLALEQEAADLDASRVVDTLRRRWPIVLLVPLVFGVLGYVWSARSAKVYETSAYIVLRPTAADTKFAPVETGDPDRELQTETQLIDGGAFRAQVDAKLGHVAKYTVAPLFKTSLIAIVGRTTNPQDAADGANAAAELYVSQRRGQLVAGLNAAKEVLTNRVTVLQGELKDVEAQLHASPAAATDTVLLARQRDVATALAGLQDQVSQIDIGVAVTSGGARVSSLAAVPNAEVAPKPRRTAVLLGLLGVLVGLAAAFVVEVLTDALGAADDLERRLYGVQVLATVPGLGASHRGVLLLSAPQSASAEALRGLRTSLQFLGLDRPTRRIQITSALEDEGASVIAANLAVAFAGAGLRVVVVDGDLRKPALHTYFGVDGMRGFTSVLVGQSDIGDALQPIAMQGWLRVLTAGPRPTNPAELLASGHLSRLLVSLEERCDLVIIDSPPVLPYTDAAVIASFVDATVLVASPGSSKLTPVRRAVRRLRLVDAHLAGVVISDLGSPSATQGGRRERKVDQPA